MRSEEIEDAVRRWLEAKMRGDRDAIVEMLSADVGTLAIGTDASEWFEGPEDFTRVHGDGGAFQGEIEELQGHSSGPVGWAAIRASVDFGEGERLAVRLTLVLVKEGPAWRIVQSHASVPQPG